MSGILNSGKLATLLERLTATRAARLDAAITSRASATDYTSARAENLDYLDASISSIQAGLPVPTSLQGIGSAKAVSAETWGMAATGAVDSGAVQSSYSTLLSDTGAGVLQFIKVFCNEAGGSGTDNMQLKLVINGVDVWESSSGALAEDTGFIVVGAEEDDETAGGSTGVTLEALRYTSGFSLQVRNNSSTTQYEFRVYYKYYTTD